MLAPQYSTRNLAITKNHIRALGTLSPTATVYLAACKFVHIDVLRSSTASDGLCIDVSWSICHKWRLAHIALHSIINMWWWNDVSLHQLTRASRCACTQIFSRTAPQSSTLSTARKTTILPTHLYLVPLMVIPMEFHKTFATSVTALFIAVPCWCDRNGAIWISSHNLWHTLTPLYTEIRA